MSVVRKLYSVLNLNFTFCLCFGLYLVFATLWFLDGKWSQGSSINAIRKVKIYKHLTCFALLVFVPHLSSAAELNLFVDNPLVMTGDTSISDTLGKDHTETNVASKVIADVDNMASSGQNRATQQTTNVDSKLQKMTMVRIHWFVKK